MNQVQADRIYDLLYIFKRICPSNVNMEFYLRGAKKPTVMDLTKPECGTSCCFMGLAPKIFPRKFRWVKQHRLALVYNLEIRCGNYTNGFGHFWRGVLSAPNKTLQTYFGISKLEYRKLFTDHDARRRDKYEQIKYVESFMDKKGWIV